MKIEEYWDGAHNTENVRALTGNTLSSHIIALNLDGLIEKDLCILCIGIGTAQWIRELCSSLDKGLLAAIDKPLDVAKDPDGDPEQVNPIWLLTPLFPTFVPKPE